MRLVADESIDGPIVARLRDEGHEIDYVAEMSPSVEDDFVLNLANRRPALLMTADKDFGELVFRLRSVSLGVVLVRLAGLSASLKAQITADALRLHGEEMIHAFSVISPGLVRIRREI